MFSSDAKRGGRPTKPADDKRSVAVTIRFRRDEITIIEAGASSAGLSLSEYIRAAVAGNVTLRQVRSLSAIDRHDLARIGVNLNQIARVNGDAAQVLSEIRSLMARLDELV